MAKKITLLLDAGQLRWALRAALEAASSDYVTPVLCSVNWIVEGKYVHLFATDRYRVHEALVPRPKGAANGSFMMDREQAQWILNNSHRPARSFPNQQIRISFTEGVLGKAGRIAVEIFASVEVDAPVFRYDADAVPGNYPPVHGLFAKTIAAEGDSAGIVGLNPKFIGSLQCLVGYRGEPIVVTVPKGSEKLSAILVQNVAGTARALVQPMLLTSNVEWQGGEIAIPEPVAKAAAA